MKRFHHLAVGSIAVAILLSACTGGSSSGGPAPGAPTPPAGSTHHMYISSIGGPSNGAIFVYQMPVTSGSTPVATVNTLSDPMQLFMDKNGNLFVPFLSSNIIWVFKTPLTNASTPTMQLFTKSPTLFAVTEDGNGNLYAGVGATNCCIDIFNAPVTGGATANAEMTYNNVSPHGLAFVRGLASDSSNNLYVSSNTSIIKMTPPITASSVPAVNVPTPQAFLYDVVLDAAGNLYAANGTTQGAVDVFTQPLTSSSKRAFGITIPGAAYLEGLAIDPSGNLWISEPGNNVWEIAAPITASSVPQKILTGIMGPFGIAFGP